jgi:cytidylate kinase
MNDQAIPIITIDGPSGTGKGTLCHALAEKLQWHILDSGLLYRQLALLVMKKNIELINLDKIIELANTLKFDLTQLPSEIRSEACGQMASKIAAIADIRKILLKKQHEYAVLPGLVTDGRDMGTVVFPNAQLKIYLDASTEERAKRRHKQLQQNGIDVSLSQIVQEVEERDLRDRTRTNAPLIPAVDAMILDTTAMTIEQTVDFVLKLAEKRGMISN